MQKFYDNRLISKIIILHFRCPLLGESPPSGLHRWTEYPSTKKSVRSTVVDLSSICISDETLSSIFSKMKSYVKNCRFMFSTYFIVGNHSLSACTIIFGTPCMYNKVK